MREGKVRKSRLWQDKVKRVREGKGMRWIGKGRSWREIRASGKGK